tara:strand:- start:92 stop:499 length:408 start_codon:yes stop_codon:yes gene_type:complete
MPYDKDGKYYRKPVYSEKDYGKNAKKDSGKEFIKSKEQGKQFQKKEPKKTDNNNEIPSGCKKGCLIYLGVVVVGTIGLLMISFNYEKEQQDRKGRSENQYQQDRYIQCLDSAKAGMYGSVQRGKDYCWEKLGKYK